jgi:hypothetical protein
MGAGFDFTGSYRAPLVAFFAATLLAVVLMTRLGPYRYPAAQRDENNSLLRVQAEGRTLAKASI